MNEGGPLIHLDDRKWLQVFRDITNSTNERTIVVSQVRESGIGHTGSLVDYEERARAIASALVLANMNSIPFDWVARLSVGGTHLSLFIVKQLPVLQPEAYIEQGRCGCPWIHLVVPRVLELTYTSEEMSGFASDLGYQGLPFLWNKGHRHCLKSELDGIFAHMYGLSRPDLEWILEAPAPSSSFPGLRKHEIKEFGEFRTQRYVLEAFDLLESGVDPNLICTEYRNPDK